VKVVIGIEIAIDSCSGRFFFPSTVCLEEGNLGLPGRVRLPGWVGHRQVCVTAALLQTAEVTVNSGMITRQLLEIISSININDLKYNAPVTPASGIPHSK